MSFDTFDFAKFTHGNDLERSTLARELVASFKAHGSAKLVNHGLPDSMVTGYMRAGVDFFAMPLETKMAVANEIGPKPQRGFGILGVEQPSKLHNENINGHTSWGELRDAREHFDAGPPEDDEFPNKWPDDANVPEFRRIMESCYYAFQQLSMEVMSAVELGLDLPPDVMVARCQPVASEMRLNHYPLISLKSLSEGNTKRIWPHTDLGIISLLFQDQVGGLEIEDRPNSEPNKRSFIPVLPADPDGPSSVVVLIGDTMQRWTNDLVPAGLHQVSVPPSMKTQTEGECPDRYSGVFFVKAHRNASVAPLPQYVTEERPAAYDDISALQYHQQKVGSLY
ncbi:hypothetical protein DL770_007485 [Monosporascus sp. CRB-9-2]|nr:hypothetical protein DL770_007485 [Monosporascus sp. CRB-9-2]